MVWDGVSQWSSDPNALAFSIYFLLVPLTHLYILHAHHRSMIVQWIYKMDDGNNPWQSSHSPISTRPLLSLI
jgi:hypothetical protein